AEVVVGVPEAFPRVRLAGGVAQLLLSGEGSLGVREGLLVLAELGEVPCDCTEDVGLPGPVAGPAVQVEGVPGVVEGLRGPVSLVPQIAQAVVDVGLSSLVAGPAVQLECVAQFSLSIVEAAQPDVHVGEAEVRVCLRAQVAQPPGGGYRGA